MSRPMTLFAMRSARFALGGSGGRGSPTRRRPRDTQTRSDLLPCPGGTRVTRVTFGADVIARGTAGRAWISAQAAVGSPAEQPRAVAAAAGRRPCPGRPRTTVLGAGLAEHPHARCPANSRSSAPGTNAWRRPSGPTRPRSRCRRWRTRARRRTPRSPARAPGRCGADRTGRPVASPSPGAPGRRRRGAAGRRSGTRPSGRGPRAGSRPPRSASRRRPSSSRGSPFSHPPDPHAPGPGSPLPIALRVEQPQPLVSCTHSPSAVSCIPPPWRQKVGAGR